MDKIVMTALVVAVVVVLVITFVVNPFGGGSKKTKDASTNTPITGSVDETPNDEEPQVRTNPNINYTTATYGQTPTEVTGNCTLYRHVVDETDYQCFGFAGEYSIPATNEYKPAESEKYFCKPTQYGCKLYQKVRFQLS